MAQTLLPGYPQNVGAKVEAVIKVDGPTLYSTGGQTIDAKACGMTYIEYVGSGVSSNGTYWGFGKSSGIAKTQKLVWVVAATAAEAGAIDLHASSIVVYVRGFL